MLARAPRDPSALRDLLADDIEFDAGHAMGLTPEAGVHHGPDAVMEFFREWARVFAEWSYDVIELAEHGDAVVAELHQRGTGRASGVLVEFHWWQVWTLRDGKIVRGTNHFTRDEALASL